MSRQIAANNSMAIGVIIRKSPGVTRWARWSWRVTAVLPGAPGGSWTELRRQGEVVDYHVGTLPLTLWPSESEAYMAALSDSPPCLYTVLRHSADKDRPFELILVTASPFEAQLYTECGEELVEKVPMPDSVLSWVRDFAATHHQEQPFIKRQRKGHDSGARPDIRSIQPGDVYRAPHGGRKSA